MTVRELFLKLQELYTLASDPTVSKMAKFQALVAFLILAFGQPTLPNVIGDSLPEERAESADELLAELETESLVVSAGENVVGARGEFIKKLLPFLLKILPLFI